MTHKDPTVVALSGGVDSAVAAAMLVDAGEQVIGITMRLYDAKGTSAASGRCCGPRDIEDARRVCEVLDIPFYVVDFADTFRESVIDDFVDTYLKGFTPNPCIRCNQSIKFTPLLTRARQLGATSLVTGHYARIDECNGQMRLRRGVDANKDQSYFLFSMPIDELRSIRFPLGGCDKDETRALAKRYGLPNATKKESQEICFIPDGDYAGFVERAAKERLLTIPSAGEIVTVDGTVVGRHKGVHRYTIGQRRGVGDIKLESGPAYVVDLDREHNRLVVGAQEDVPNTTFEIEDVRWFVDPASVPFATTVQIRHRGEAIAATVTEVSTLGDKTTAKVSLGGKAICARGQAAVFYDEDVVLGGGWIC